MKLSVKGSNKSNNSRAPLADYLIRIYLSSVNNFISSKVNYGGAYTYSLLYFLATRFVYTTH